MPRIAAKVTPIEFFTVFNGACAKLSEDPRNPGQWLQDIGKVGKDIGKVKFDFENTSYNSPNQRFGSNTMPPAYTTPDGVVYIQISAGGDWEFPVTFIIYLDKDGKTLRGYIPKEGNAWNHDTKEALGNDEEADAAFLLKWLKKNKKLNKETQAELEEENILTSDDGDAMYNENALLADIQERVKVK